MVKILLLAAALAASNDSGATDAEFDARRRAMVEVITAEYPGLPGRFDPRVKEAIARVPRHLFVPPAQQPHAYENRPLPIGHGQTISQPYVVALMTDLLKPGSQDRVLEIGTGSGYQAAVLAELVRAVYTIEIVEPLAIEARQRLDRLGYRNVEVRTGDGYKGWEERAPFDAIMVTAGADEVPPPLLRQLKPGGRMVIPVGPAGSTQSLTLIEKQADGSIRSQQVIPVRFVPLTRER
ncbi:MAG TPA: protein-L-isoaspartate(D-aspartate) O-methyltransferase [Thermoanaerobaculia bacterium]|nr:protein-L-isoaspartate(D-aspartate) O-methyltransferase [Thermoanaerobaculia bacterium]